MESVLTLVLALGVAGTAIRLLPMQENYVFEGATNPVQGKPLDEIDDVIKAKIATGLVEDTRVKTARPNPPAAPGEREIVQDTRILTAKPTPEIPGEPVTKFTDAVPPPTISRASQETKVDVNLQAPPPIMEVQGQRGGGAVTGLTPPGPSPPPQGSTSAR